MVQKYLKPHKKFISRNLIKKELNLQNKEFDELVTLLGIFPYVPNEKQKVDRIQDFFYKVTDFEKIKTSEVFKTFKSNKKNMRKKEKYEKQGLFLRSEKIHEEEYNFINLVRDRFKSFGHAVDEMSSSLSNLCLSEKLKLDEEIPEILKNFKDFVVQNKLLKKSFISVKGIYYEVVIKNIKVIWLNPFNGVNLQDIVEIKKDEPVPFKWSEPNFLDYASEEEDSESFEIYKSDKLDVSLLSFSIPFQKYHLKLVLHKLKNMEIKQECDIFKGDKFLISLENFKEDVIFVIKCCSGEIVKDSSYEICIGEKFEEILDNKIYCHPQYIFDCLNAGKKLNIDNYLVGKIIPRHVSPFKLKNFIDPDLLTSLSKNKRNKLQDIVDGFEDVHYKNKK